MHLAQGYCHSWKHFGTRVVGYLSVPSYFLECLHHPKIFIPLRQTLFSETEVIWSHIRGIGWVFLFSNRFLVQKLLDRVYLVSWSIIMVENPIGGTKFRPFPTHSFM